MNRSHYLKGEQATVFYLMRSLAAVNLCNDLG